jgi:hypothetical protein
MSSSDALKKIAKILNSIMSRPEAAQFLEPAVVLFDKIVLVFWLAWIRLEAVPKLAQSY